VPLAAAAAPPLPVILGAPATGTAQAPATASTQRSNRCSNRFSGTVRRSGLPKDFTVHFTLLVDKFGVKYTNIDDANHLIKCSEELYETTVDWEGKVDCGVHLKLDYNNQKVTLSIPAYVKEALIYFKHEFPKRPQHSPPIHTQPGKTTNDGYSGT